MVEVVFEDSAAGSLQQALVGRYKVAEAGIVLYVREEGEDPLSPEEEAIDGQDRMKREQLYRALRDALENQLTSAQRHRLWLYAVDGLTEDEIASREQIRQQSVSRRINAAKKILKKFLKRWV